jgi:hypothetical protein
MESRKTTMRLLHILLATALLAALAPPGHAQPLQDPLLDHMTGQWVLQGTIAGQQTVHDVQGEWLLGHQYIQLHEVSREKNAQGQPAYEAIVLIGWDAAAKEYACLWLDSTGGGGLTGKAIAHAKPGGDALAFLFLGTFHTTFLYNKATGTWRWTMDDEEGGKLQSFARVKLTRK